MITNCKKNWLQIRTMVRAGSTNGEKRNAYRILVGKSEGKRQLGRPRRRWVDNINIDLGVIEWSGMDPIDLTQDRTSEGLL
jgi:hypothetical protein